MAKLKIGIVGCGAIGGSLARAIVRDFKKEADLAALYDIDNRKSKSLSRLVSKSEDLSVGNLKQLISKSRLVIEASSALSSLEIAKNVLARGRDIMVMSVGGIVGGLNKLCASAKKYNARLYIPSGAISGIDALKAAKFRKISRVILTTRKNPSSFANVEYIKEKGVMLDRIKKDTLLFSGSAKQAIKHFAQNINVAATISIAGIGLENTIVRIIASPAIKRNIHEIEIESEAGRIITRTENVVHPDNPKTSYLAVLSAVAALKQILQPIKVGT